METRRLLREDSDYPPALKGASGLAVPEYIDALGNMGILQDRMLGLLCSEKCPGDIIMKTYDAVRALRDAGVTVIGGFHSPMEKEALYLLLRGKQAVIICPARTIQKMRMPTSWRRPMAEDRLLLLSPFDSSTRRIAKSAALRRNAFIAAMADEILVPHATPGGKVETLCREILASGKPLYTFDSAVATSLTALGAQTFDIARMTSNRPDI